MTCKSGLDRAVVMTNFVDVQVQDYLSLNRVQRDLRPSQDWAQMTMTEIHTQKKANTHRLTGLFIMCAMLETQYIFYFNVNLFMVIYIDQRTSADSLCS